MLFQNDKVSDVLAVLTVMRNEYRTMSSYSNITELRRDAIKSVAEIELQSNRYKNLHSAHETIRDACARRLRPDVANIGAFDELAEQWLHKNSVTLKDILLKHSTHDSQLSAVNNFFRDTNRSEDAPILKINGVSADNQTVISKEIIADTEPEQPSQGGGAGFGDYDSNKEVETAAISFVTKLYHAAGWQVDSVEPNKCGFDLLCTHGI